MNVMADALHGRPNLGILKYYDSQVLSDVTIRYGKQGERVFHGHRVILCSKSRSFEAMFTGAFAENVSKEVVLIEDDPDAVEATLKFLYGVLEHDPGDATGTSENLNYWVDLHTVADKYDVPELRDYVTEQVGDAVRDYAIDRMPKDSGDAAFVELVCRVYDLESHASKENRLLCKEIVTWLSYEKELSEEVGLRLGPVFRDCVAAKAEFAQDMILLATKETSAGKHFLQGQFRCDICEYDWEVVIGDPQSQSCPFCLQTPQQLRTFRLSWS